MSTRRAEIVQAALRVAEQRGLAAMSMRAVADQLGASVMGLYRHVPSKEVLLDELVGRLLAEIVLPDPSWPWQERLHHLAGEMYDLAARYPTVVPLLLTRAYVAPEAVRVVQATSTVLRDAGVPAEHVPRLERLVSTFLLGYATSAAHHAFWPDPDATDPPAPSPAHPARPPFEPGSDRWRAELERDVGDLIALFHHLRGASRQPPAPHGGP